MPQWFGLDVLIVNLPNLKAHVILFGTAARTSTVVFFKTVGCISCRRRRACWTERVDSDFLKKWSSFTMSDHLGVVYSVIKNTLEYDKLCTVARTST